MNNKFKLKIIFLLLLFISLPFISFANRRRPIKYRCYHCQNWETMKIYEAAKQFEKDSGQKLDLESANINYKSIVQFLLEKKIYKRKVL